MINNEPATGIYYIGNLIIVIRIYGYQLVHRMCEHAMCMLKNLHKMIDEKIFRLFWKMIRVYVHSRLHTKCNSSLSYNETGIQSIHNHFVLKTDISKEQKAQKKNLLNAYFPRISFLKARLASGHFWSLLKNSAFLLCRVSWYGDNLSAR